MQIANPIYDTFFKFLLEDTYLAKKLLSAVIEEDIISFGIKILRFTNNEVRTQIENVIEKIVSVIKEIQTNGENNES